MTKSRERDIGSNDMHSLLSDRFLKSFAGEIRRQQKHPTSRKDGQKPDADDEMAARPDGDTADETHEKDTAGIWETR